MNSFVRVIILLTFFFFSAFGCATAQTFNVNWIEDAADFNPGDGVCRIHLISSHCSLRAAIQEANALPGEDTIILLPNVTYNLTIAGTGENNSATGDLDITDSLII